MLHRAIPRFPAADIQQAVAFYVEKLGFEPLFDYGDYAGVQRDAFELHFWQCDNPTIAANTACMVQVSGIAELYAACQAAGVVHPNGALARKPWGVQEFVILDRDGNGVFFFEDDEEA